MAQPLWLSSSQFSTHSPVLIPWSIVTQLNGSPEERDGSKIQNATQDAFILPFWCCKTMHDSVGFKSTDLRSLLITSRVNKKSFLTICGFQWMFSVIQLTWNSGLRTINWNIVFWDVSYNPRGFFRSKWWESQRYVSTTLVSWMLSLVVAGGNSCN